MESRNPKETFENGTYLFVKEGPLRAGLSISVTSFEGSVF